MTYRLSAAKNIEVKSCEAGLIVARKTGAVLGDKVD